MEIKEVISEIRKSRGLSQEDMAGQLFVTRQAVSRWENGETMPSIDTLKLISETFGVSADKLLGLTGHAECQSCGMTLKSIDDFGTKEDDTVHTDYCRYCMQKESFTHERTIDEMIESNLRFLEEYNAETGTSFTPDEARRELKQHLATLKRWKTAE